MSARIGQIIEIIEEVRANFQAGSVSRSISQMRLDAVRTVAAVRRITTNSVADKFIRQLSPEVTSTTRFDNLLQGWLVDGSPELRDIVVAHAIDNIDRQLIDSAFHLAPPEDTLLAEEFGLDASTPMFMEGREQLKIHLTKERNRLLVAVAKKLWASNGEVVCSICSFSFLATYGDAGEGYIEAHHTTPVSELAPDTVVRPNDLAPVCSNCHRIIHRHRPWLTIAQMKAMVTKHSVGEV